MISREKRKAYYENNKEKLRARAAKWREDNKELLKTRAKSPERKKQLRAAVERWKNNNIDRVKVAHKLYTEKNKDKIKNSRLLREYGITLEEFKRMRESITQCEICEWELSDKNCHIDHCHTSGKVRGLLCFNCNAALGMLKESELIMNRAIEYLKKHGGIS